MQTLTSKPVPLGTPEAVLNLWACVDENGCIFRLAGKAYVMDGDDNERLSLLRRLSATDFLSAAWHKVPSNFVLVGPDNQQIVALAASSVLSEEISRAALFGPLIEQLAKDMPTQLRCENGEFRPFRIDLPQKPLAVTTVVLEFDDGRLVPMISGD